MANGPTPYGGFGSFLGLPEGVASRDEMLAHRRKENLANFRERMAQQAQAVSPEHRGTFQMFAQLGDIIGNKLSGGGGIRDAQLTPQEQRGLAIMEGANERIKTIRDSEEYKAADPMTQSFMTEKAVADAAYAAGDTDTYLTMTRNLYDRRMKQREADARVRTLEAEADVKEAQRPGQVALAEKSYENFMAGQPETFVRVGGDVRDPETLRRMPDGTVVNGAGEEVNPLNYLSLEDALAIADFQTKAGKGAASAGSLAKQIGSSTVNKEAALLDEANTMVRTTERLANVFQESTDPQQIVGKQGRVLSFAKDMLDLVTGAGKTAAIVFQEVGEDGKGVGKGRTLNSMADEYVPDDMLPPGLRPHGRFGKLSEEAVRYKGAIMQLIYANARMQEPGARQLSDADIRNSAETLGVASGDPLTVMRRLGEVTLDRLSATRGTFERRAAQAAAFGLDPSDALTKIYGADALDMIDKASDRARQAFMLGEEAAGAPTAPEAGAVVSDPQTEARLKALGL